MGYKHRNEIIVVIKKSTALNGSIQDKENLEILDLPKNISVHLYASVK